MNKINVSSYFDMNLALQVLLFAFCVRMINSDILTTIAGTGTGSFSGDNGVATSATLNYPTKVAVDTSGRIITCNY